MPLGLTGFQRESLLRSGESGDGWSPGLAGDEDSLTTFGFDNQEYEFGIRLPELLLMRTDRFSMASSVEARVPFLDPSLVDYVYRLPLDLKVRSGISKYILKRAVADIVPERVSRRPKQGFTPPVSRWFAARHGQLLKKLMTQDTLRAYFDVDYLGRVVASADPSSWESGHFLWPILNFGMWHKYWIEGEPLAEVMSEVDEPAAAAVGASL
jgi:asparagine synthase (glutamine-hydrolysing)